MSLSQLLFYKLSHRYTIPILYITISYIFYLYDKRTYLLVNKTLWNQSQNKRSRPRPT